MSKAFSAVVSTADGSSSFFALVRLSSLDLTLANVLFLLAHHQAMVHFAELVTAVGGADHFSRTRDLVMDLSQKHLNCVKKQEEHLSTMIQSFVEVKIATALVRDAVAPIFVCRSLNWLGLILHPLSALVRCVLTFFCVFRFFVIVSMTVCRN